MTVHVGEVTSQIEIQPPAGGSATASAGAGPPLNPSWVERERHRRLAEDDQRVRARLAGDRFDA